MQVILRRSSKHIKHPLARRLHLQHTSHIPAAITVIGRTPHGTELVVVQHLKAFLAELMSAQDVVHPVDLEEFAHDLRTKRVAGAARGEGEFVAFWVGVGPDEVGHGAFVGDFAEAVDDFDLVNGVDGRGEAYFCVYSSVSKVSKSVAARIWCGTDLHVRKRSGH